MDGFIMENPIKMDDLGENPPFLEIPILVALCIYQQPHLVPTSLGLYRVQQALMMSVVFKALSARPDPSAYRHSQTDSYGKRGEWSKYTPHAKLRNVH